MLSSGGDFLEIFSEKWLKEFILYGRFMWKRFPKVTFYLNLCYFHAMGRNVKLSDALVEEATILAKRDHRSVPKQIEFYFRVAKAAEENPDLPFKFVLDVMNSLEESTSHPFTEYEKYRSHQTE